MNKYRAKKTEYDGIKFPSKLEGNCYLYLKQLQKDKRIDYFLRQIGFDLPGGYRHFVDFLVKHGACVTYIEAKGRDLPMGKMKRTQVESLYHVKIHLAKNLNDIDKALTRE